MRRWQAVAWLPFIATVEWRAEGRGRGRPAALLLGIERVPVAVLDAWVEGPAVAGQPVIRVFVLEDAAGRLFRVRDDAFRPARVETASPR